MTCPQLQAKLNILKSAQALLAQYDATDTTKAATAEMRTMTEEWEVVLDELAEHFTVSIKQAQAIMDKNIEQGKTHCLGPVELEKAFGIKLDKKDIPKIPFSKEELERAAEKGQFLVLRANVDDQGQPLTMKRLRAMMLRRGYDKELDKDGQAKGKITAGDDYSDVEKWWNDDPIELRWALVDKEVIAGSTKKDYHEQTKLLKKHITEKYQGMTMPAKYIEAIKEFDAYVKTNFSSKTDAEINVLLRGNDWQKYAQDLSELKLNDLMRKTPAEESFDEVFYYELNDERLNERMYNWTKRRYSGGSLVDVGGFDSAGADPSGASPDYRDGRLGVSSSCS